MAELIPGGVAAFFAFGYLGYLWTYSYTWPLGIILASYVLTVSFALQRFTVFDVYIELPTAAELGLVVAWLLANASLLPPLVPRLAYQVAWTIMPSEEAGRDSDIEGGVRVETYGRQAAAVSGGVFLAGGAFTLAGVYGDNISFVEQLLYGVPGVAIGLGLLIYGFYGLFASARRAERADGRYIVYLYLFAGLPPLAYGAFHVLAAPFEIVPLWIALVSLAAIVGFIEINVLGVRADRPLVALEGDPRYARAERYPVRILQRWLLVTMLPVLVVYTVCWAVESFVADVSTGDSLGAAAAASLTMALVALCFGGVSSPTRATGYFADADSDDETAVDVEADRRRRVVATVPSGAAAAVAEPRRTPHAAIALRGGHAPDRRGGKRRAGVDL